MEIIKSIFLKLGSLDRRLIFVLVALSVLLPKTLPKHIYLTN